METTKKTYRVRRDTKNESEVILIETRDKIEDIPVERIMSRILHNIITKEDDTKNHENAE